ncbi:TPA: hypothetical protein ACPQYX_000886 [Haemophilus influenzae]|uniref:hypothetical protein n=1 Tax=Haemophilus influenzae TaxID=727 RepID=UPI00014FD546|nr:hypothetical protein [Haemophilus influenzae]AJO90336.1 hypothetical protein NTHIC486_01657 [Haemophilus influenzae]AWP55600.1 hypothetical protein DLK00_04990 [Haemophilus influenzae]AXP61479.1 hypothetical protein CH624_06090 [Haemophilus influenzae]EDK06842.1 hypothetical protein CGSHiAA_00600 [Haemophilus influenzae PittAA]KIP47781.1 hypothetical protein SU58_08680 [Haemophilus influenzae]
MIDDKVFIGIGTTLIMTLVGWVWKSVNDKVAENQHAIKALEKQMQQDFQSKELAEVKDKHFESILKEVRDQLKEINQKLDKKVDK